MTANLARLCYHVDAGDADAGIRGPDCPAPGLAGARRTVVLVDRSRYFGHALTMTTLPLGEVKSHLSELVGRVHDHHERVTVTVHGRPAAVLVALEDLEQLEETLAVLRDAGTMERLASSDAELARGESVSADELAEVIRQRSADR
jgi:antitoxin YefM